MPVSSDSTTDERNPDGTLTEKAFSRMVEGAMRAHGVETQIDQLFSRLSGQNGRSGLISLPGGQPVRLNVPSAQDLMLEVLRACRVMLQTERILLVALNDMDTRIRQISNTSSLDAKAQSTRRGLTNSTAQSTDNAAREER